jgi:hypothetical protein
MSHREMPQQEKLEAKNGGAWKQLAPRRERSFGRIELVPRIYRTTKPFHVAALH